MQETYRNQLMKAAGSFKEHNFLKALKEYDDCIQQAKSLQKNRGFMHNITSAKAGLLTKLQRYEEALQILNEALQQDPYHVLCLTRRSQIYKKQNKFKKATKDLDLIGMFSPDNIQISALKMEIQNLMTKNTEYESESSEDQVDQQQLLNFSNLRMIDRKSVTLTSSIPKNKTKMRVTLCGDITYSYKNQDEETQSSPRSQKFNKQQIDKKLALTKEEIVSDKIQEQVSQLPKICIKAQGTLKKSILKNRNSTLYVNLNNEKQIEQKCLQQSHLGQKVSDIDGKPIYGESHSQSGHSSKQVEFRKSLFGNTYDQMDNLSVVKKPKSQGRKSCLKRSSFLTENSNSTENISMNGTMGSNQAWTSSLSRFSRLSRKSIDGNILKKTAEQRKQDKIIQNQQNENSDSQNGSSHNIFGSKQQILSKEIRDNFGLDLQSGQAKKKQKRTNGTKSILKRSSDLFNGSKTQQSRKPKKSVMFKG